MSQVYATNSLIGNQVSSAAAQNDQMNQTRWVSSTIIENSPVGDAPKDTERIVEVPTYEEQITYVPVKEVREIVKVVPVYDVEYVDRVVEIPRIEYVDKTVEVPVYQDVVREVKVPKVVDRPVEVLREVRVPKVRYVEKEVEVPGGTVYVDKPYEVRKEVYVNRHIDTDVPVIIAQTARPVITEVQGSHIDVEVKDYVPEVVPVDIHVAKPVESTLTAVGLIKSIHKVAHITAAQYNTLLKSLNPNFAYELPYVSESGRVDFVHESELNYVLAPSNVSIEGYKLKSKPKQSPAPEISKPHYYESTSTSRHPATHHHQSAHSNPAHMHTHTRTHQPTVTAQASHYQPSYPRSIPSSVTHSQPRSQIPVATQPTRRFGRVC